MNSLKPPFLALAGLALLLTACETVPSSPPVCPPIVDYSTEFMAQAADELEAIAADGHTAIPLMIEDYGRERAMLMVCQ